jgi:hypothetical protein
VSDFGARLNEHEVVLLGLLFAFGGGDLALVVQISLVPHQHDDDVVASLAPDIVDPFPRILERLLICPAISTMMGTWTGVNALVMSYTTTATLESRM